MEVVLSEKEVRIKKKFLREINNEVRAFRGQFSYYHKNYWNKGNLIEAYCNSFKWYESEKEKIPKDYSSELQNQLTDIINKHRSEVLETIKTYFMFNVGGDINDHITKSYNPKTFFSFLFD